MCNSESGDPFSFPICSLYKTLVVGMIITNSNKFNSFVKHKRNQVKMRLSDLVYNVALVHTPLKCFFSYHLPVQKNPCNLFYHLSQR